MQTYLELEGKLGNELHTSTSQLGKSTSMWKAPFPKKAADKKGNKAPIKSQFKVRLIEKSLPVNPESEAVATTATSLQTLVVKPSATTAKPSLILLTVYNLAQNRVQEIPNPTVKFQEEECLLTPNHGNPSMAQQPTTAATFTAPMTRDDTPWPNTILALTHLFVARASWPIPSNVNEVSTPIFVKIEMAEEKTPLKQAATPHAMILNPE